MYVCLIVLNNIITKIKCGIPKIDSSEWKVGTESSEWKVDQHENLFIWYLLCHVCIGQLHIH